MSYLAFFGIFLAYFKKIFYLFLMPVRNFTRVNLLSCALDIFRHPVMSGLV